MKFSPALLALSFVLVVTNLSAASLKDGLTAHWPLNDLRGEHIKDVSGHGRDATGSEVLIVDGRGGKVMAFNGLNSEFYVPDEAVFEVTGDYGVSFWMRVDADSEKDGPIYAQPSFGIANFRGALRVTFRNPEYPGTGYADLFGPKINDGEWHHVVLSYRAEDGETVLFLDAQEVKRRVFAHKPEVSAPTTVGFAGRSYFAGDLSDLRVYARPLDLVDVAALFNAKLAP